MPREISQGLLSLEKGEWILGDNCQYLSQCCFIWGTLVEHSYTHCYSLKINFQYSLIDQTISILKIPESHLYFFPIL